MANFDREKAQEILVSEFGYKRHEASMLLDDMPTFYEPLANAVQRWLQDRTILEVDIDGLSIEDVMESRGCNFLIAVRYLNRILDPMLSKDRRQRMVENLRQPVARW